MHAGVHPSHPLILFTHLTPHTLHHALHGILTLSYCSASSRPSLPSHPPPFTPCITFIPIHNLRTLATCTSLRTLQLVVSTTAFAPVSHHSHTTCLHPPSLPSSHLPAAAPSTNSLWRLTHVNTSCFHSHPTTLHIPNAFTAFTVPHHPHTPLPPQLTPPAHPPLPSGVCGGDGAHLPRELGGDYSGGLCRLLSQCGHLRTSAYLPCRQTSTPMVLPVAW